MDSQDLLQFVDGTQVEPPKEITKDDKTEMNPEFVTWRKLDRLALSWIKATVTEAVLGQIMHAKNAFDAWTTLEKSYGSQSPLRIMLLRKELLLIKKGSIQHRRLSTKLRLMFFAGNVEAEGFSTAEEEEIEVAVEINFRDVEISLSHNRNLVQPIHNINALLLFANFVDGRDTLLEAIGNRQNPLEVHQESYVIVLLVLESLSQADDGVHASNGGRTK
ncbi:hypothetical protein EJ110_NYTH44203 [Nymphaea thermarum]|nr:hypothetical protein EJ110_NYTH44203 [Nymphaea thermarum]